MHKAFIKKEFIQNIRNYKFFIIGLVFIFFGFSNPIMARLMNEILLMSGLDINLADPTSYDAWIQFFKNYTTVLFIFLFLFASIITSEIQRGTLISMLTRGLKRSSIIMSKFLLLVVTWIIGYSFYFLITYLYTPLLLPGSLNNLIISGIFPLLFGIFMIMLLILGSVSTKNTIGALAFSIIGYLSCSVLSIFEQFNFLNPYILISKPLELIGGEISIEILIVPMIITLGYIFGLMLLSIFIFNRQSI